MNFDKEMGRERERERGRKIYCLEQSLDLTPFTFLRKCLCDFGPSERLPKAHSHLLQIPRQIIAFLSRQDSFYLSRRTVSHCNSTVD